MQYKVIVSILKQMLLLNIQTKINMKIRQLNKWLTGAVDALNKIILYHLLAAKLTIDAQYCWC